MDPETLLISSVLKDEIIALQHVGHVVRDLEQALAGFSRLYGLDDEDIRRVPDQGEETIARFAFVTVGDTEFEIIEPVSEEQKALLLNPPSGGAGINHVAWRVRDLDRALAILQESGIRVGHVTPHGPIDLPNKRIVYLDPETAGGHFVELIEFHAGS